MSMMLAPAGHALHDLEVVGMRGPFVRRRDPLRA